MIPPSLATHTLPSGPTATSSAAFVEVWHVNASMGMSAPHAAGLTADQAAAAASKLIAILQRALFCKKNRLLNAMFFPKKQVPGAAVSVQGNAQAEPIDDHRRHINIPNNAVRSSNPHIRTGGQQHSWPGLV